MKNALQHSPNSPNQPPGTANNKDISARARANRRIDASEISAIARLCAKSLTESEACRRLGIRPRAWFNWKDKHNRSEKFAELLEAFRADRIENLIAKIEAAADGKGLKQPDWRSAAFLLSVASPNRYAESGMRNAVQINISTAQPAVDPAMINRVLDKLFVPIAKPVVIAASSKPAALPEKCESVEP